MSELRVGIKKGLNANQIKLIAIVAMTVDHLTWAFFPGTQAIWYVYVLHIIGRLTAPIMWFFIAEGCHYTRNRGKYIGRLFAFAVVSHFAYDFAFGIPFVPLSTGVFNQTSVMWSLAWAVVLVVICHSDRVPQWGKIVCIVAICLIASFFVLTSLLFMPAKMVGQEALTLVLQTAVGLLIARGIYLNRRIFR